MKDPTLLLTALGLLGLLLMFILRRLSCAPPKENYCDKCGKTIPNGETYCQYHDSDL